jgi:chemotaxis protein MotA
MARKGSDISTFLGMGIGFGGLLVGFIIEGGNPLALIGISALIIIVAGTMGAIVISFGLRKALAIPKLLLESLKPTVGPSPRIVQTLLEFAEKARRDGILSLEDTIEEVEDPTMRKGLRLMIDGTESEVMAEVLETDVAIEDARLREEAAVFDAAGGFSPTMGIIGTVMGLVLVLSHLGGDAKELGHSIAAAFIATLYGIGLANLVWLPVGAKLKNNAKATKAEREMMIVGIRAIQQGESPALVREKLEGFLEAGDKKALEEVVKE